MVKYRRKEGAGGDGLGKVCSQRPIRARDLQMCACRVRNHLEGEFKRLSLLGGDRKGAVTAAAGDVDRESWVEVSMLYT